MDEDVDAASKAIVYPAHSGLEMGAEVCGCAVEDVEAIALELVALGGVCLDGGEPWCIEDLDEGLDVMRGEEGGVEDGREGAEVECAGALLLRGGEDEVHGSAHGLHDLGREVVEANHGCCSWKRVDEGEADWADKKRAVYIEDDMTALGREDNGRHVGKSGVHLGPNGGGEGALGLARCLSVLFRPDRIATHVLSLAHAAFVCALSSSRREGERVGSILCPSIPRQRRRTLPGGAVWAPTLSQDGSGGDSK